MPKMENIPTTSVYIVYIAHTRTLCTPDTIWLSFWRNHKLKEQTDTATPCINNSRKLYLNFVCFVCVCVLGSVCGVFGIICGLACVCKVGCIADVSLPLT